MRVFFLAVGPALLSAPMAMAELVSTDEVSEAMRELVEDYSCKDVLRTVALNENPLAATTEEFLNMLVLKGFVSGYALARQQAPEDSMTEILENCQRNLDEPFSSQVKHSRR